MAGNQFPVQSRSRYMYTYPYNALGLSSFFGGWSVDQKLGTQAQFYYSRSVDFRKKPSQFSILPGTTNLGNVTDLIQGMTQTPTGAKYAVGDAGNVYTISTSNVVSLKGKLTENGAAGIVYRADSDHCYIAGATGIARIKYVTGSMSGANTLDNKWFQRGNTTTSTCYKTGGTNTYSLKTAATEASTDIRTFVSDIEPLYSIKFRVNAKGTGDWTLTLHDDANNVLGTVTVTNANLPSSGQVEFVFSTPIRILVSPNGRTYHTHLTSTVADGSVMTTTANSLADCDIELTANALVTTVNGLHPMINFLQYTLIGNGRYVAQYEPLQDSPTTADFSRHRITLPPGFETCGFAQKNLLCVIGAERRSSSGEFQEGALFFWDGISQTYNDWWPVPEGSPEGLFSHKNTVWFTAGGALYRIVGSDQPIKVRTFRGTDSEYSNISDTTHQYPNMMTVRRGVLLIGYPSYTTNQTLEHGVYSFGAISREYPDSFGFNYRISTLTLTNNGTNNLKIGSVHNFGDTLFMSWRDDSSGNVTYGLDIVNNSSAPAPNFVIESLYYDNSLPYKNKNANMVISTFNALPAGTSIRLKYRLNGGSNWTYSDTYTTGATVAKLPITQPYVGVEFGMEGTVSGTTPYIQSLQMLMGSDSGEREIDG